MNSTYQLQQCKLITIDSRHLGSLQMMEIGAVFVAAISALLAVYVPDFRWPLFFVSAIANVYLIVRGAQSRYWPGLLMSSLIFIYLVNLVFRYAGLWHFNG